MNPSLSFRLLGLPAAALALLLLPALAMDAGAQQGSDTVDPSGLYTRAQAEQGKDLYEIECTICHAPREFAGPVFQRRWLTPPVSGIFVHIMNTMPQDAPGSLSPEQTAAIVAYILELNGQPAGPEPLPTETEKLTQIRVPVDTGDRR